MAYELACPACAHKVLSPFVRVGAVVICGRCSTKYRIADEHVRRTTGAAAKPAEAVVQATAEAESSARQLSDGSVAGLSGLSELMESEPDVPTDAEAKAPPLARAVPAAGGSGTSGGSGASASAGRHARHDVRRRNVRLLYLLAGLLGLAMAGVGGALWWAVISDRDVSLPPPTADELPISPTDAAAVNALPLLTAEPVSEVTWERVDEPHKIRPRTAEAILRDEARVFTEDGREFYTATLTADGEGIVTAATLHLILVDMADKAVAKASLPVAFFGEGRQQKVRVPFPEGLPSGLLRVDSWVDVKNRLPAGAYLREPDVRAVSPGARTLLRLRAINREDLVLYGTRVELRAVDDKGATIARYALGVPWPIEPGMQLAIRIALPPPGPPRPPAAWVADVAASAAP